MKIDQLSNDLHELTILSQSTISSEPKSYLYRFVKGNDCSTLEIPYFMFKAKRNQGISQSIQRVIDDGWLLTSVIPQYYAIDN